MEKLNKYHKWNKVGIVMLIVLFSFNNETFAQLKPANAIYYFNEYLVNPAIAGKEAKVVKASLGYRQQLSSFAGAPQNQFLAVDYGFDQKSGVGLKFNNDKAGLLRQTSVALTYAYHLPLNEEDRLSFGISGTFTNNRLNESSLIGDNSDPDAMDVNQRKTYFDSDFGIVYHNKLITVQAVFPNMIATLKNNRETEADYSTFFTAVSYKFETDLGLLEPKLTYRGIKGFKNVLDVGTNFLFNSNNKNQFNLMGFYHSSKSATVGFGITFNSRYSFTGSYSINTTLLQSYSNGDFEIGIGLKL
ncbi:type IX secretion system membrane protein PorP/SprF [Pedobacter psychrodurus]|uniref:Type IX secretion system membrane protein PorP/SprF n=1 Tax=Pedobacter psychrodurus TaxID=2530456 RepID=A0A4R0PW27_9SPHI|nr:PorP/SprF family type IX secretion system membrane protein [Pedobacter psychrodurus]TCD26904.1 type IX secretion system membrane protein PorP/SprF [Pedobacter psychrodurus]